MNIGRTAPVVVLTIASMVVAVAMAQEASKPAAPQAASPAMEKPANAWSVNCASGANAGVMECQMSQNLTEFENGAACAHRDDSQTAKRWRTCHVAGASPWAVHPRRRHLPD